MDSELYRNQYNEIKQRNQETLERMQRLEHELDRVKAEIRDKQMRSLILRAYNQACTQETLRLRAYHELLWGLDDANSKQEALSGDRVDQLCRQLQETLLTRRVERIPHDLISQDPAGLVDMITSQIIAQPLLGPPPPPLSSAPQRKKLDTVSLFFNNTDDGREALDHGEAKYDETLKRVRDRVCQVYSDARIQTAVFECIQAKAECLGSVAELEVLKQVADEWQVLEANHGVKRDGDDTTSLRTLVDSVAQKQRRVYQLMASNRLFPQRIEKQRQQLEEYAGHQGELTDKLAELCHALVGTVREHLDAFHRTPLAPDSVNIAPRPTDGTRLGQIKDALHPYLELSREGVLQSLTETLTRVNALVHSKQPEMSIREPLESLAERWNKDLMESGVQLPEALQNEDSVDLIVQSAKAYTNYIKQRQATFLGEEETRIKRHLQTLDLAEKSAYEVNDAIEERRHLEKGSIAMEYTFEDKTFAEWMDVLSGKHDERKKP